MDEELDPREQARNRRRDRDATASERALMRPGLGKQFKQVLDVQAKRGREADETLNRHHDAVPADDGGSPASRKELSKKTR